MSQLLTTKEVSEILKVSEDTVKRSSIPYCDISEPESKKRIIRYKVEDVDNWLKRKKIYPIDITSNYKKRKEYVV